MSSVKEIFASLRSMDLPPSLAVVANERRIDASQNIADLYFSPQAVHDSFSQLLFSNPEFDWVLLRATLLREMDSPAKIREYFQRKIVKGEEHELTSALHAEYSERLYGTLLKITALDLNAEHSATIRQQLGHWEDVALDIICDHRQFFTKAALGNQGTISEFLGRVVLYDTPLWKSPNAQDGKYIAQLKSRVDYDAIVEGRIRRAQRRVHEHQSTLLSLLSYLPDPHNIVTRDFWEHIERNEDFIAISHCNAVRKGYENAPELLCKRLENMWTRRVSFRKYFALGFHFKGKTAYDKFLAEHHLNPENQRDAPKQYDFVGRKALVLLDYEKGDGVTVRYASVDGTYEEKSLSWKKREEVSLDRREREALFTLVDKLETWMPKAV